MALNVADWMSTLTSLNVSGVSRMLAYPPQQLSTADLPTAFPRYPVKNGETSGLTPCQSISRITCELVIIVEAGRQGSPPTNFIETLTLVDALDTALTANLYELNLDAWSISVNMELIGETPYHVVVAELEASG